MVLKKEVYIGTFTTWSEPVHEISSIIYNYIFSEEQTQVVPFYLPYYLPVIKKKETD
jgi:hypothetical protein